MGSLTPRRLPRGSVVFVVLKTICFNPLCGAVLEMFAIPSYEPSVMVIGNAAENCSQILTLSGRIAICNSVSLVCAQRKIKNLVFSYKLIFF